jgi:hypothetical protein
MRERILKIVPFITIITSVIYLCSCKRTYDSNNIPDSSTDMNKQEEVYSKSNNVRTEATGVMHIDSTQNGQMTPANSTGVPHVDEKTTK